MVEWGVPHYIIYIYIQFYRYMSPLGSRWVEAREPNIPQGGAREAKILQWRSPDEAVALLQFAGRYHLSRGRGEPGSTQFHTGEGAREDIIQHGRSTGAQRSTGESKVECWNDNTVYVIVLRYLSVH